MMIVYSGTVTVAEPSISHHDSVNACGPARAGPGRGLDLEQGLTGTESP
jgi:hypothetical protein